MGTMKDAGEDNMSAAIEAAMRHGMPIREAARKFGVPRTTLQRRLQRVEEIAAARNEEESRIEGGDGANMRRYEDTAGYANGSGNGTSIGNGGGGGMRRGLEVPLYGGRKRTQLEHQRTNGVDGAAVLGKGPHKAINGKIRVLCTSAGSTLDQLRTELENEGKPIFKLSEGQSPFPVPQCIVDELRANAHQREYLPAAGLPALCEDIASWGARRLHLPFTRDDVLIGPGTKELLFVLQTVYYGDLLLPNPSCTSYAPQANIAGRNMFWLPTYPEDRWVLRPEVLEEHCIKDPDAPRVLIINSPSNPTGCVYTPDELQAVARVARKYRVLVVSDEVYANLHHAGEHHSIAEYYPEGTVISGGLSKSCGAGGWRMGYWLFPSAMSWLRKAMLAMASETYTSVASPIQHAARRAFVLDCAELTTYKQKCVKILRIIGEWCYYQLQKMYVDVQPPQGAFYLFPSFARHRKNLAQRGITTDLEFCTHLLHDTGVALLPGSAFGRDPQELYVRLAFVDFKGDLALYLIESMDNFAMDGIDTFIQSVCPNLDCAMSRLASWLAAPAVPLRPLALPGCSPTAST